MGISPTKTDSIFAAASSCMDPPFSGRNLGMTDNLFSSFLRYFVGVLLQEIERS